MESHDEKLSVGKRIVNVAIGATMGSVFGAMGYEGTGPLKEGKKMLKNGVSALKTVVKKVRPKLHKKAVGTLINVGKYIGRTSWRTFKSNSVNAFFSWGTRKYGKLAYHYYTGR